MTTQVARHARDVREAAADRVARGDERARTTHRRGAGVEVAKGRSPGPNPASGRDAPDAQVAPIARVARDAHVGPALAWVVAVVNLKGGSGKTTTAMHLAAAWHEAGERVMVIDADPQGSAVAWASDCAETGTSLPWPVLGRASGTLHSEKPTLAAGWEVMVIDCPPAAADHRVVRSAIRAADCIVVPCRPTAPDTRRVAPTRELVVELATEHDLDVSFAVLLTQTRAGTIARTAYREALDASGVAVLDTEVPLREVFAWAEGSDIQRHALEHYRSAATELNTLRKL